MKEYIFNGIKVKAIEIKAETIDTIVEAMGGKALVEIMPRYWKIQTDKGQWFLFPENYAIIDSRGRLSTCSQDLFLRKAKLAGTSI